MSMSNDPYRAEALSALRQLRYFLDTWNHKALEQGLLPPSDEVAKILIWVQMIDLFLTDRPRELSSYSSDLNSAKRLLEGEVWIVHLSDGGYSRLVIDFFENRIWLDQSVSLPKAIVRWSQLAAARR